MTYHAVPSNMVEILKSLNCSYLAKIITRNPKIVNLTKVTELYPFLESKKWYLLFKEILWSPDLLVETIKIRKDLEEADNKTDSAGA